MSKMVSHRFSHTLWKTCEEEPNWQIFPEKMDKNTPFKPHFVGMTRKKQTNVIEMSLKCHRLSENYGTDMTSLKIFG